MRSLVMTAALAAALAVPASAWAQTACLNDVGTQIAPRGSASLNPPLTGVPNTGSGSYFFSAVPAKFPGQPVDDCGTAGNNGSFLPGSSCSGNSHMGTAPVKGMGGSSYRGVCIGSDCDGGGPIGTSGVFLYQLHFSVATIQAAATDCSADGLANATFGGSFEGLGQ